MLILKNEISCPNGRQRRVRWTSSRTASRSDPTAATKGTRLPNSLVLERGCHGWKIRSHGCSGSNPAGIGTERPLVWDSLVVVQVSEGFLHVGNKFLAGLTMKERNVVFL